VVIDVYAKLLAKSLPRPIRSEAEHARLADMLLQLDERDVLSPEEEALAEVLTLLIEDYEEKYHPLPLVSPNESLKALMEERGLKHKDIWPVLGNKGAATEVLSGRRSISKSAGEALGGIPSGAGRPLYLMRVFLGPKLMGAT
jgi:HTH-type transcriptional regulator/antitoxin HigA